MLFHEKIRLFNCRSQVFSVQYSPYKATRCGKTCLVIDKRDHIGGNIYTEEVEGIQVHRYGAHIFHTSRKHVWEYINQFTEFNHFINSPIAIYKDELYNMPFNMNTFHQLWGVKTPAEAQAKVQDDCRNALTHPRNLEEQALALVGQDVYEKLVEGYTEKQWGRECKDLPAFTIKRLPLRYTYDNNYFKDPYQGIPKGGYTRIIKKLLEGVQVCLNTDFFDNKEELSAQADKVLFTGMIDQYYDYCYGELEYRSLRFDRETLDMENYREMQLSIIQITKFRTQESLSISILILEHSQRQLLQENILQNGKRGKSLTIL